MISNGPMRPSMSLLKEIIMTVIQRIESAIAKVKEFFGGNATVNATTGSTPLGNAINTMQLAVHLLTEYETLFPGNQGNIPSVIQTIENTAADKATAQQSSPALTAMLTSVLGQVQAGIVKA